MVVWEERRDGWTKRDDDARSNADIDYGRIIHSASFRRLQGKTQILNLGDSDFYRTRLTHSLEVAQIAGGISRQLRHDNSKHPGAQHLPDLALIQAIGSTHDLGHPPFGHGGEVALNFCMAKHGGFEGNGQTIRILSKLEKFSDACGANLMRRTLLGTLKYPVHYSRALNPARLPRLASGTGTLDLVDREWSKPPKCFMDSELPVVEWILAPLSPQDRDLFTALEEASSPASSDQTPKPCDEVRHFETLHKSFDCSIMDLADDISFGVHDLEDACALRLLSVQDFERHVPAEECNHYLDWVNSRAREGRGNDVYGNLVSMLFGTASVRKKAVSQLVGYFVQHCTIEELCQFQEPLIRYRASMHPEAKRLIKALKRVVYKEVIRSPEVQHLEFKGQQMVVAVFETLRSDPEAFLPRSTFKLFETAQGDARVICDHVAGMTDTFLLKTYERLFSPRMGSVFDRL